MRAIPLRHQSEKTLHSPAGLCHSRFDASNVRGFLRFAINAATMTFVLTPLLISCAHRPAPAIAAPAGAASEERESREALENLIPRAVADRAGWARDIQAALMVLDVGVTRQNMCAVAAVIEQESGFRVDPVVPGLPAIASREIDVRAEHAGVPRIVVHAALELKSPNGRSYADRIAAARTEKDLSDIYEDFIGTLPLGRTLFADRNPIRTRGPMQVNVVFAEQYASVRHYPYPANAGIADELFTRRGSIYFGTAHLLGYHPAYDDYLYRFADFNAGQYASRNAAFQNALSSASAIPVVPDGALLPHDSSEVGSTELALRAMDKKLGLGNGAIHDALAEGKGADFGRTALYRRVFEIAERNAGHPFARASLPRIQLHGPKIGRRLTTEWYARRVDERFKRCLRQ